MPCVPPWRSSSPCIHQQTECVHSRKEEPREASSHPDASTLPTRRTTLTMENNPHSLSMRTMTPTQPEHAHDDQYRSALHEVEELAEVLSVTAQKLKTFTQGRGWVQKGEKGDKGKGKGKPSGKTQSKAAAPAPPPAASAYPPRTAPASASAYPPRTAPPAALPSRPAVQPAAPRYPAATHVTENTWEQSLHEYVQEPTEQWYGDDTYAAPAEADYEYADAMEENTAYVTYADAMEENTALVTYAVPTLLAQESWDTMWQQHTDSI
eukprot:206140-Amphidinium_carterae.1